MNQTATTRTRYTVTAAEAARAINAFYRSPYAWLAGCHSCAIQGPQPIIAGTYVPSSRTRRDGTRLYSYIPYGNDESDKLRRYLADNGLSA